MADLPMAPSCIPDGFENLVGGYLQEVLLLRLLSRRLRSPADRRAGSHRHAQRGVLQSSGDEESGKDQAMDLRERERHGIFS
jgi:hypothetical protein